MFFNESWYVCGVVSQADEQIEVKYGDENLLTFRLLHCMLLKSP